MKNQKKFDINGIFIKQFDIYKLGCIIHDNMPKIVVLSTKINW